MKTKTEKIIATMPEDERASLALGFYNFDRYMQNEVDKDSEYEHFVPHGWSSPQPWGVFADPFFKGTRIGYSGPCAVPKRCGQESRS